MPRMPQRATLLPEGYIWWPRNTLGCRNNIGEPVFGEVYHHPPEPAKEVLIMFMTGYCKWY